MKRQPIVVSKISAERANASGALPITNGARVMDSTPPAIAKSISPARIARPAAPTASRPDAQRRFRVWPGTDSGMPASSSAMRATLRLSSPAWLAQPKYTSSTAAQSRLGCFAISALIGAAARSSARTLASEPPKRPIGVRTASHTNTSRISFLPESRFRAGTSWSFKRRIAAWSNDRCVSALLSRKSGYAGSPCLVYNREPGRGKRAWPPRCHRNPPRNFVVFAAMTIQPTIPTSSDTAAPAEVARVTPMMEQYLEIKAANPGLLLFYRMGDFYELFFEDAETASRALGIMLTKRGKHLGQDIPMCGVPVEKSDDYLHR